MSQCKIFLDNYTGQYLCGSPIQGRVLLNFSSQTPLRVVKVRVICHEHTEWLGTESYYDSEEKTHKSRDVVFKGDSDVFTDGIMLYGDQHSTTALSMGQHIYPFTIRLPQNIPGTYQSEKGSVVYKISAIVDRPMAFDYEDEIVIVVHSPIDLGALGKPELLRPTSYSDEKTLCCWCCAQGPISMDIELPKKIIVPGETVEVQIRVTNMSNSNVEGVKLELKQRITYKAMDPSRDEKLDTHVLVDLSDVGVGAHGENTYAFKVNLPPNVSIPNFAQCRLFKSEYMYKAVAKLPSIHRHLEIKMYPEVGHIAPSQGQPPSYGAAQPPVATAPPEVSGTYSSSNIGWAPPTAPLIDLKEQEASRGYGTNGQFEPPPPSYGSLGV
ncbi:arrestin domain-containing protein 3-like [Cylas formicarius]|uniref:arrestin domain-containing protein 3-like n=1 Tax=Cylas formicarius TaxID=197179 RepID=UPI002958C87E|nr:arrestin domain-containing protein 3-like [Cylas formicarius]